MQWSDRSQPLKDPAGFYLRFLPGCDIVFYATCEPDLTDGVQAAGDFIFIPSRGESGSGFCVIF